MVVVLFVFKQLVMLLSSVLRAVSFVGAFKTTLLRDYHLEMSQLSSALEVQGKIPNSILTVSWCVQVALVPVKCLRCSHSCNKLNPRLRVFALVFHMALIALALLAVGTKGNRLKGRSIANIIVRDGIWAFMLVFGGSLVPLKFAALSAADVLVLTVFMVFAIISNVLPASLSRAAALYRYVGC